MKRNLLSQNCLISHRLSSPVILLTFILQFIAVAQPVFEESEAKIKVTGQWFLSYMTGKMDGEKVNFFTVKRGYININAKLNDQFAGRITPDISVDQEGDGAGDLELRLKYAYLKWNFPQFSFFSKSYVELGLVHLPWQHYEENINRFRMQGTMFLPRNRIISSADFGITFISLFGGQMDENYQKTVSKNYPGRYGSVAIGIYNGGGYHDFEKNNNKPVQARLSIRPAPDFLPGLQVSYHGVWGKGNTEQEPDWVVNQGFLTIEHKKFVVTATYYDGKGNFSGSEVDSLGKALNQYGYSVFAEYKILSSRFSLIGRYDYFIQEEYHIEKERERYIFGIAYFFFHSSKFLLNYDHNRGEGLLGKNTSRFEVAIEVRF